MYLFIDTLSAPSALIFFDASRSICHQMTWEGRQSEFDTLIESIDRFRIESGIESYRALEGIVCVLGPGSFTGVRVTSLVANTLGYSFGIPLFPMSLGTFFALQDSPLPWIAPLTKREVISWMDEHAWSIVGRESIVCDTYSTITDTPLLGVGQGRRQTDYAQVIARLDLSTPADILRPLYAREPNVTLSPVTA